MYKEYDLSDLNKPLEEIKKNVYQEKKEEVYVDKIMEVLTPRF